MYQSILDKYSTPPAPEQEITGVTDESAEIHKGGSVGDSNMELQSWKDSDVIMALSNYLREIKDHGIRLVKLDGRPALHFDPPLDFSESERMECMHQAFELLADALPDMEYLLESGARIMPDHPGFH